jgi:hypothetical protein
MKETARSYIEMAFEFNEKSGSLFPRVDKEHEKQPDASGRCKIDSKMYKIAMWKRESASGMEYWSLAFTLEEAGKKEKPKQGKLSYYDDKEGRRHYDKKPQQDKPAYDDDIPF